MNRSSNKKGPRGAPAPRGANTSPKGSNGAGKAQQAQQQAPPAEVFTEADHERMANRERYLHVLQDLTGRRVTVHKKDGGTEDGIFHTVSAIDKDTNFAFVFKGSKAAVDGKKVSGYRTVIINAAEVVQIVVESMVIKEINVPRGGAGGFATDTDISSGSAAHLNGRELAQVSEAWLDADMSTSLDDVSGVGEDGKVWDQFEANYRLTGRRATYDESLYTTSLDTTKISKEKMAQAAKIAQEIEGIESGGNIHMAEERGQKVDRKGLDEEALYSGVLRTGDDVAKATGNKSAAAPPPMTAKAEAVPAAKSKLNAGAKEFKFNPGAAAFTPSFAPKATPPTQAPPTQPMPPMHQQQMPPYGNMGPGGPGGYGGYPPRGRPMMSPYNAQMPGQPDDGIGGPGYGAMVPPMNMGGGYMPRGAPYSMPGPNMPYMARGMPMGGPRGPMYNMGYGMPPQQQFGGYGNGGGHPRQMPMDGGGDMNGGKGNRKGKGNKPKNNKGGAPRGQPAGGGNGGAGGGGATPSSGGGGAASTPTPPTSTPPPGGNAPSSAAAPPSSPAPAADAAPSAGGAGEASA